MAQKETIGLDFQSFIGKELLSVGIRRHTVLHLAVNLIPLGRNGILVSYSEYTRLMWLRASYTAVVAYRAAVVLHETHSRPMPEIEAQDILA